MNVERLITRHMVQAQGTLWTQSGGDGSRFQSLHLRPSGPRVVVMS